MSDASAAAAAQAMAALAIHAALGEAARPAADNAAASVDTPCAPSYACAAPPPAPSVRCILTDQSVTTLSLICRCLDAASLLCAYQSCRALSAAASHPLTFQHDIRLCVPRLSAVQLSGPKASFHAPSTFGRAIRSKLLRHFRILTLQGKESSGSSLMELLEILLLPTCPPLHALTILAPMHSATAWNRNPDAKPLDSDRNENDAAASAAIGAGAGAGVSGDRLDVDRDPDGVGVAKEAFSAPHSASASPGASLRPAAPPVWPLKPRWQPIRSRAGHESISHVANADPTQFVFKSVKPLKAVQSAARFFSLSMGMGSSAYVHRLFDFAANPSLSFLRVLAVNCSYNFAAQSPLLEHLPRSLELLQLRIVDAAARSMPNRVNAPVHPHWILPPGLPAALAVLPRFVHLVVADGGLHDLSSVEHFRSNLVDPPTPQRATHLTDLRTLERIVNSCPGLEAITWLVPVDLQRLESEVAEVAAEAAIAAAKGGAWNPDLALPSVRKLFDVVCTWLPPVALHVPAAPAAAGAKLPRGAAPAAAAVAASVNDNPLSSLPTFFPDLRSVSFASYHAPNAPKKLSAVEEDDLLPLWPSGLTARLTEMQATVHRDFTEPLPSMRRMLRHIASGEFAALHSLTLMGNKQRWADGACFDLGMLLSSLPSLTRLSILQIRVDSLREFRHAPKLQSLRGLTWPYSGYRSIREFHPDLDLSACFPSLTSLEVSHAQDRSPRAHGGLTVQALCLLPTLKWVKWAAGGAGFVHPLQLDSIFTRLESSWAVEADKLAEKRAAADVRAAEQSDRFAFQMDMMDRKADKQTSTMAWEWMSERLKKAGATATATDASANAGAGAGAGPNAGVLAGAALGACAGAVSALPYIHSSHGPSLKRELTQSQDEFDRFEGVRATAEAVGLQDAATLEEMQRTREKLTRALREKQQQWDRFQTVREIEAEMIKFFFPPSAAAAAAATVNAQQHPSSTPSTKSEATAPDDRSPAPELEAPKGLSQTTPLLSAGASAALGPPGKAIPTASSVAPLYAADSSSSEDDFDPVPVVPVAGAGAGVASSPSLGVKRGTAALAPPAHISAEAVRAKQAQAAQRRAEAEANRAAKMRQREEQRQKQQQLQQQKQQERQLQKQLMHQGSVGEESESPASAPILKHRAPLRAPPASANAPPPPPKQSKGGAGLGGRQYVGNNHHRGVHLGGPVHVASEPKSVSKEHEELMNPFLVAIRSAMAHVKPAEAAAGGAGVGNGQQEDAAAAALFAFGSAPAAAAAPTSAPAAAPAPFSFSSPSFGAAPAAAFLANPFAPFATGTSSAAAAGSGAAAPPGGPPVFAFSSPPPASGAVFAPVCFPGGAGVVNPFLVPQSDVTPAVAPINPFAVAQPAGNPFAFNFAAPSPGVAPAAIPGASFGIGSATAPASAANPELANKNGGGKSA